MDVSVGNGHAKERRLQTTHWYIPRMTLGSGRKIQNGAIEEDGPWLMRTTEQAEKAMIQRGFAKWVQKTGLKKLTDASFNGLAKYLF